MRALYLATVANRVMPAPTPRYITAQKRKPNVQHHSQADDLGLVLKYLNGECFATHARDKPIRLLEPSLILTVPEVHWAERS